MMAAAIGIGPAVEPTRYRLDIVVNTVAQMSAAGGEDQTGDLTASAWIRVVLRDTTGGQVARIVVDSITGTPDGTMTHIITSDSIAAARGITFDVSLVRGKIVGKPLTPIGSELVRFVFNALPLVFPGVQKGIGSGPNWADTTSLDATTGGVVERGQSVMRWEVGDAGERGITVHGTSTGTHAREQPDEGLFVKSTLRGTRTVTLGEGGVRAGREETVVESVITSPHVSAPVPLTRTMKVTLTAI